MGLKPRPPRPRSVWLTRDPGRRHVRVWTGTPTWMPPAGALPGTWTGKEVQAGLIRAEALKLRVSSRRPVRLRYEEVK